MTMTLEDNHLDSALIDGLQLQLKDFEKLQSISEMQREMIEKKDFDDQDRLARLLAARQLLIDQISVRDPDITEMLHQYQHDNKEDKTDATKSVVPVKPETPAVPAISVQQLLGEIASLRDQVIANDKLDNAKLSHLQRVMSQKMKGVNGGQKIRKVYQVNQLNKFNQFNHGPNGYGQLGDQGRFTDNKA